MRFLVLIFYSNFRGEHRMKRLLGLISLILVLVSCIDNIVVSTLYQYSRANSDATVPEEAPAPMQKIDIKDTAGNRTVGWYYHYSDTAPVVLYFHGNASNLQSSYANGLGEKLMNQKVNFAIFDYPKYGLSTGELNEKSVLASGQAVLDFLKAKYPNAPILLWGRSMGCAIATLTAKNNHARVSKLILTSPWDSFWKVVQSKGNLSESASKKAVIGNEWDTENHAKSITMPVLIHHGTKDEVVPWEMGKNLSGSFAGNDVTFVSVEGADHDNLLGNDEWEDLSRFIRY